MSSKDLRETEQVKRSNDLGVVSYSKLRFEIRKLKRRELPSGGPHINASKTPPRNAKSLRLADLLKRGRVDQG